jgi:hypothetical protein
LEGVAPKEPSVQLYKDEFPTAIPTESPASAFLDWDAIIVKSASGLGKQSLDPVHKLQYRSHFIQLTQYKKVRIVDIKLKD